MIISALACRPASIAAAVCGGDARRLAGRQGAEEARGHPLAPEALLYHALAAAAVGASTCRGAASYCRSCWRRRQGRGGRAWLGAAVAHAGYYCRRRSSGPPPRPTHTHTRILAARTHSNSLCHLPPSAPTTRQAAALSAQDRFAVLFDAGSSGTRVHVYQYAPPERAGQYATVRLPSLKMKTNPGLSSFAPDGDGVADYIQPLIDFARDKVRCRSGAGVHRASGG